MNVSVKDFQLLTFTGFYYGIWDIDENLYRHIREEEDFYFHIDPNTLEEGIDYTFDYDGYKKSIVDGFIEVTERYICDILHIDCHLSNPDLYQPKYYNYDNDRIYCDFQVKDFKRVMREKILPLMRKHKERLEEIIHDNHTSYDGFWSFMDNHYEDWYSYLADSRNYNDKQFSLYFSYIVHYLMICEHSKDINKLQNDIEMEVYEDYESMYEYTEYTDACLAKYPPCE